MRLPAHGSNDATFERLAQFSRKEDAEPEGAERREREEDGDKNRHLNARMGGAFPPNGLEPSCPAEAGNGPLLYGTPAGETSRN
jgi:hypothetical protein